MKQAIVALFITAAFAVPQDLASKPVESPASTSPNKRTVKAIKSGVPICPMMEAKRMPEGFLVEAMAFTGPAGDGRSGSAGFVVKAQKLIASQGTRLSFTFERDASGYGFQIIHPLEKGHILVSVSPTVTLHCGGSWSAIGWGNPAASADVKLTSDGKKLLPLKPKTEHSVISELSSRGKYRLWINDILICEHKVKSTERLVLKSPKKDRVWGGSSWNRVTFAGEDFKSKLKPGHTGLILGPMDGSGPRQNFKEIKLSAVK